VRRKNRFLIGLAIAVATGLIAVVASFQFGQTSPLFAKGDLVLAPELNDKVAGIDTLYIIVFDEESPMPMPYGATRFKVREAPVGQFMHFVLTNESMRVMMGERPEPKRMRIKARLDMDGNAGPDQPGDLVGEVSGVPFGSRDVTITIARRIE